jgi:fructose-1,6-bisphosphatase/inositol monophosphatase family enzyme
MIPDPGAVSVIITEVAATEILPRFQRLGAHEISEKAQGELVTIADERAETALEKALLDLLPGAAVVGEEAAAGNPASMDALTRERPVWVIDPVDGTQNFADGRTRFAVIVALVAGGETLAGWIHEPIRETTVWAVKGEGVFEGGERLRPKAPERISQFQGSLSRRYRERAEKRRLEPEWKGMLPRQIVRYRCVGAEYADLARGELQFARYGGRLKPWDHAAGVLIHAECGGYHAIAETGAPYQPGPTLTQKSLILAPDRESWEKLYALLGD